jgi:hypothetical protein
VPGGGECGADLAAQFGADGNVLQIRIDGREAAGGRGRGLKGGVHARVGIGQQRQRVNVIRFELGKMAVFEHQARDVVLLGQLLEHVLRGGDGLALAATGGRRQAQMREEDFAELLGGVDVEAPPASSKMRSPTRSKLDG